MCVLIREVRLSATFSSTEIVENAASYQKGNIEPHSPYWCYAPLEKMEYLKLTWSNLSFDKIYSLHCTGLSTNDETVRRLETLNYDSSKVKLRLLPSSFQYIIQGKERNKLQETDRINSGMQLSQLSHPLLVTHVKLYKLLWNCSTVRQFGLSPISSYKIRNLAIFGCKLLF